MPHIDLDEVFDAWVNPLANELGLGVVDVERLSPRDVPVRVIPRTDPVIERLGRRLTGAIGARDAVRVMNLLGITTARSLPGTRWFGRKEVECPECEAVWEATIEELEGGWLQITHMAYGCDHRAVLNEIEETALESAREGAGDFHQALNDEATAKGY